LPAEAPLYSGDVRKAIPRKKRPSPVDAPLDVRALLERVARVGRGTGAGQAGAFLLGDGVLVSAGDEVIADDQRSRAWLSSIARSAQGVRYTAEQSAAEPTFPGPQPASFVAVPSAGGEAVVYAAGKAGGFTDADQELLASLVRLIAAALAQRPAERQASSPELVSMISHELRNPLASIRGFGVLLRDREDSLSEEERHEFVEAIVRQTDNLSNLIGDVLDVSQMVAGRFRYAATPYDPSALLAESIRDVAAAYPSHRFHLDAPHLPAVRGDSDRMKQVLLNLLSNACRFSAEASDVRVDAHVSGDRMVVDVADSGVGIEAADMPRLFGRFERLHRVSLPRVKGTGLGLYITKQIVEAHGGTISATSEPGVGTTFTFAVPLLAPFA